jgi:hypothetical protein
MIKFIKYVVFRIRFWWQQRKKLKQLNKKDPFIYK